MDAEIADLESFIDSYVADDPISSEVFTNTNVKSDEYSANDTPTSPNQYDDYQDVPTSPNGRENTYDDFQEELLAHQRNQKDLKSESHEESYEQWIVNELGSPPPLMGPHDGHRIVHGWDPSYPFRDEPLYPTQDYDLPTSTFSPYHSPPNTREAILTANIAENDLRHRLNNGKSPSGPGLKNGFDGGRCGDRRQQNPRSPNNNDELSWRKSDRTPPQRRDSDRRSTGSDTSSSGGKGERKNKDKTPPKRQFSKKSNSRHSSQSSSCESMTTTSSSKVVSGRSKAEVRSWLRPHPKNSAIPIQKQMEKLEVSQQTKDLPQLIESAQAFITNENKLREVAEMVCTKAMRNPQFAENGAKLCNEMSKRMINGTSFRTVILNIVQGHFKNRRHIMASTIKNPEEDTWSGFVTFLIELYLHLLTSSNERLKALVNPVFYCFFQMLSKESANFVITKCFAVNFKKVGAVLEAADPQKMSKLISLLRDSCVLPNDLSTEARRYLLQSLESYARGWKNHALDNSYYDNYCSSKSLAN